ncbi:vesicle coat protein [Pilobolus umbonatus]|nr:vesicle coat protein [Pilobolus umbonatus]
MNALIALLHFCEVHGPCVVFCTQAIHNSVAESGSCVKSVHTENDLPTPPNGVRSPPSISSLRKTSISTTNTKPTQCPACTAQLPLIPNGQATVESKRLITVDEDDPTVTYVGTKSPQQNHLYKAVRLACVRSLTAEFCPGRDGPVLFGDEENGYVMSYMFKLRDSQARGEARFYSLMMLMTDRVYLISCWPFLVNSFRSMALNLQERANMVFQKEKEMRQSSNYSIANSRRVAPMSQEQFFRGRSNTSLRSLVDLLGIKDIYSQIQAQFSYILKLSSRRRMEKINQGRSASSLYTKLRDEYLRKKEREKGEH